MTPAISGPKGLVFLFNNVIIQNLKLIFDKLLPKGFMPIIPPVLVKPEVMKGMGKIKFIEDEDAYLIQKDDLYLIG